jgi:uncharacterized membrane protein
MLDLVGDGAAYLEMVRVVAEARVEPFGVEHEQVVGAAKTATPNLLRYRVLLLLERRVPASSETLIVLTPAVNRLTSSSCDSRCSLDCVAVSKRA